MSNEPHYKRESKAKRGFIEQGVVLKHRSGEAVFLFHNLGSATSHRSPRVVALMIGDKQSNSKAPDTSLQACFTVVMQMFTWRCL